jgi:hypothetical protein
MFMDLIFFFCQNVLIIRDGEIVFFLKKYWKNSNPSMNRTKAEISILKVHMLYVNKN